MNDAPLIKQTKDVSLAYELRFKKEIWGDQPNCPRGENPRVEAIEKYVPDGIFTDAMMMGKYGDEKAAKRMVRDIILHPTLYIVPKITGDELWDGDRFLEVLK